MRKSCYLLIAVGLLLPLQAIAQSGSGSSGSGNAGVTTGTAPGAAKSNAPGTNSLGTAQSSGGGVTTGRATGSVPEDKKIEDENRHIDRKLKGICRGC